MRRQSHLILGQYLSERYMYGIPKLYIAAFQLGCIEPDRNPTTYLKGSLRYQFFRGHNYLNAHRFMNRISRRLEAKKRLRSYDYYTLGKLIHYTADAFTYAHNRHFSAPLHRHIQYETHLQNYFLSYVKGNPQVDCITDRNIMCAIVRYHQDYEQMEPSIHNDSHFTLTACCCILAMLFANSVM